MFGSCQRHILIWHHFVIIIQSLHWRMWYTSPTSSCLFNTFGSFNTCSCYTCTHISDYTLYHVRFKSFLMSTVLNLGLKYMEKGKRKTKMTQFTFSNFTNLYLPIVSLIIRVIKSISCHFDVQSSQKAQFRANLG